MNVWMTCGFTPGREAHSLARLIQKPEVLGKVCALTLLVYRLGGLSYLRGRKGIKQQQKLAVLRPFHQYFSNIRSMGRVEGCQ